MYVPREGVWEGGRTENVCDYAWLIILHVSWACRSQIGR